MYLFSEYIGPYVCRAYCAYFRNVHPSVLPVLKSAPLDVGHKYEICRPYVRTRYIYFRTSICGTSTSK
jgi:hypothetical protein